MGMGMVVMKSLAGGNCSLTLIPDISHQDVVVLQIRRLQQRHGIRRQEGSIDGGRRGEAEDARVGVPLLHRYGLGVHRAHAAHYVSGIGLETLLKIIH